MFQGSECDPLVEQGRYGVAFLQHKSFGGGIEPADIKRRSASPGSVKQAPCVRCRVTTPVGAAMVRATSAKGPGMVANWLRNLGIGIVLGFLPLSSPLPAAPSQKVAPVAELVTTVDLPYQPLTLDNGQRGLAHRTEKG